MTNKILSLEERARLMYTGFSDSGRRAVMALEDAFMEYALGEVLMPPAEIEQALSQSGLEKNEVLGIKEYLFVQCAVNAAPRIAKEFAEAFGQHKYNPLYTLEDFLIAWNPDEKQFTRGDEDLGPYSFVIRGIIDILERGRELQSHLYGADLGFLEGIEGFSRIGIMSIIDHNPEIIKELFIGALPEAMRAQVTDIVYDRNLANEAANSFLDAFQKFRDSRKFNLENFLKYFNAEQEELVPHRSQKGSYYHMQRRIYRRYGTGWAEAFYSLLNEPVKSRVTALIGEMGKKGVPDEDRIRLIESLATDNGLNVLYMFADGGSDVGDMMVALNIHKLTLEQLSLLSEVTMGGRSSLRQDLGKCRFQVPDSDVKYDWRRSMVKICEGIDPKTFRPDEVAGAILINKAVLQYSRPFAGDKQGTLDLIKLEVECADNPVYRSVMEKVQQHYELRLKVGKVKGLVDKLLVVS